MLYTWVHCTGICFHWAEGKYGLPSQGSFFITCLQCSVLCVLYVMCHIYQIICGVIISGDVGDHVVVINTEHIAMEGDLWRNWRHFHHTGFVLKTCFPVPTLFLTTR